MENVKPEIVMKLSNLTKKYGAFTAVKNLSLEIRKGEIFGFLGPNGAGKTTTISMMCGLLKPDTGDILIDNNSMTKVSGNKKHLIGLCPQNIVIWEELTCIEQLEFVGQMYGVGKKKARDKALDLLKELGLIEKKDKLAKTLSGGMQRRLNIALALVHEPEILILDEPQAGLDPQSRILVREYIRSIAQKTTVILTTHDMDEAERLSDRVAIIDKGELLILDTPENLKSRIGEGEILEIRVDECKDERLTLILSKLNDHIQKKYYKDGILYIISNELLEILPEIIQLLKRNAIKVEDMKIRKKTLEDVFISLTGRGLRE